MKRIKEKIERMKKILLVLGGILVAIVVGVMSFGGNGGKLSDKKFTKILEDYEVFFEEEFVEEFGKDYSYGKIVVNTDGTPVMLAIGVDEDTGEDYTRIYSHDGKEVKQLKKFGEGILPVIYSDGIVAVYDYSDYLEEDDVYADLYLWDKNLEKIGEIHLENREVEIDYNQKQFVLRAPIDSEEYAEFVDFIYSIQYGNKVKPDKLTYGCNIFKTLTFFRSVPLAYLDEAGVFEARSFEDQIEELKDSGSMTQEEFLIWDYNFSAEAKKDEHIRVITEAFVQRDINLLNRVEEIYWGNNAESIQEDILYVMLKNRMTEWMEESEVIQNMSSIKIEEAVEKYTEELILQHGGKEPEFYIEEIYDEETYSDETEDFYETLVRSNFAKKAMEELEKLSESTIDKEWLDSYFALIDQLQEKAEKWEEEFKQGDYLYLEAYMKMIEEEYYLDEAPYTLYYDFCYVGEDNHLCMLLTQEYDYDAYTTLCVYDGRGGFTYYDLYGYRQWCAWVDDIMGWYVYGSNGASSGGHTLVTVRDGKIFCLFNGEYDYFMPEGEFRSVSEVKEYVDNYPQYEYRNVSYEEYNKVPMELFGVPFVSNDGSSIRQNLEEKVTNNGENYFGTKGYSTIEEAYRNIERY